MAATGSVRLPAREGHLFLQAHLVPLADVLDDPLRLHLGIAEAAQPPGPDLEC